jgi:hypothetical protein
MFRLLQEGICPLSCLQQRLILESWEPLGDLENVVPRFVGNSNLVGIRFIKTEQLTRYTPDPIRIIILLYGYQFPTTQLQQLVLQT